MVKCVQDVTGNNNFKIKFKYGNSKYASTGSLMLISYGEETEKRGEEISTNLTKRVKTNYLLFMGILFLKKV